MKFQLNVSIKLVDNRFLGMLLAINGIFVLAANMFPPIFALFVEDIGGNILIAGSISAIYSLVTALLTLVISRYGDRIKQTEFLVAAGYMCRMLAWTGYYFSNSIWQLYILQLVLALGEALGTPAFNALYSYNLDKGNYVKEWGASSSLFSVISAASAFMGGFIAMNYGFKPLFMVMVLLSAISFFFIINLTQKIKIRYIFVNQAKINYFIRDYLKKINFNRGINR